MKNRTTPYLSSVSHSYNPAVGTSQVGYRSISGEIASSGQRVYLHAWALVYPLCIVADGNYDLFVDLFAEVNRFGIVALPVEGIAGKKFINLSERTDLIGERGTIWLTSMDNQTDERGAVLAAVIDNMIHLLTLDPYLGIADERPAYLIEDIVHRLGERTAGLRLSPTGDTMGRLPVLQDIGDLLANTRVDASWYKVSGR